VNGPFSAWREGARYYVPLLVLAAGTYVVLRSHGPYVHAWWLVLALGLGVLAFFRDPPRNSGAPANELVSPADGAVVAVEDLDETPHYEGPCRRVSIFLSIFSVHVNRAPCAGTVRKVAHAPGRYMNAMRAESSRVNESNAVWLDTGGGAVTVRQISGAVARRIVCRTQVGDRLSRGEKFGMIKLGSRTELYLPPGTEVRVALKQRVRAGATVVARLARDA